MSDLKLINLPEEILSTIFSLLYNRFPLSLTCKRFYKICCQLDINKYFAKINGELIVKDKIFNSIMNSSRVFNELHLLNIKTKFSFARVLQVLTLHGDKIRNLQLASMVLSKSELINLLNTMRSLNEIVVKSITIKSLDNRHDDTRIKTLNDKTNSIETSVKNLFLAQNCDRKLLSILIDLPADSLVRLDLRFPTNDMKILQKFLCKQNQLKQLTIYTNFIQSISISHLHLTHLTIESRKISIQTIQSQQQSLKYLCIMNFPLNDYEIFDEICSLMFLEVLKIYIGIISSDKISNVSRLKYIQELTVKSAAKVDGEGQLTIFCSLKFPLLRKLELLTPNIEISRGNINLLAASLGDQLTSLRIEKIDSESFYIIICQFSKLVDLNVSVDSGSLSSNYQMKHLKLKYLEINSSNYKIDNSKLLGFFPNLRKFVVNNKIHKLE